MTTTSSNQTTLNTNNTLAFNGSRAEANSGGGGVGDGGVGVAGEMVGGDAGGGTTAATSRPATTYGSNGNGNGSGSGNASHANASNNINNLSNAHQSSMTATTTTSQRAYDVGKRKKLKSRNASVPNTSYSKDHLDAWLETCLKDASNTQLSSSSEFLDYNPNSAANKTIFQKQPQTLLQQQLQQQQQQQHTTSTLQQQQQPLFATVATNSQTTNQHQTHQLQHQHQHQHHHQQQQQQQQQQQFSMRNNHSTQSSIFSCGYQTPFSLGSQKSMPNFMKSSSSPFNNRYSTLYPSTNQLYRQHDGAQEFASLPPLVNIVGGGSMENEPNAADALDGGTNTNPNISRGFRFSDPCLLNPSDNDSKVSGRNTPDRRNYAANDMENNKFYAALMEQINLLHETNTKICRNLHETKVDIEALKHAPHWGMRHRRDSLSGLSTHSQPMAAFGGGFGSQSPALTYHSGAYTPGMMTDVVREVKEAARVREDALLSRVKGMVEERQWSLNEGSLRMMRDIEDLKSQIQHLRADRKESNKRITHLEAENKYMRQMLASFFHSRHSAQDIIYENEAFRPRHKHFAAPSRRSNSLNLNYGTIHHQPAQSSYSVEEQEENIFNTVEAPSTAATADIASVKPIKPQIQADFRHSFSSCDGVSVGGIDGDGSGGGGGVSVCCRDSNIDTAVMCQSSAGTLNGGSGCGNSGTLSPPKFALISTPDDGDAHKRSRLKKTKQQEGPKQKDESQELQRELLEAVSASKDAGERIIALENLVKSLQVSIANSSFAPPLSTTSAALANGVVATAGGALYVGGVGYDLKLQQTSSDLIPQQHQILQQSHSAPVSSTSLNFAHASSSSSRLSVAGPITDL